MSSLNDRLRRATARLLSAKPVKLTPERALASLTFDDFPRSAWTAGGPILAQHGVRGTYYAAGRYCGASEDGLAYYDADDLRAVHAAGHEVGCHSWGHVQGHRERTSALAEDADRNAAFVSGLLGDAPMVSFAYPYGELSARTKRVFAPRFATCRGVHGGLNVGVTDLADLRAEPIERRSWTAEKIEAAVAQATERKAWLIFFTHDVSDDPSPYGCTPAMLEHALATLRAAEVDVLPVKAALARATFG